MPNVVSAVYLEPVFELPRGKGGGLNPQLFSQPPNTPNYVLWDQL